VGAAELLREGENGFILDELSDPAALAALISRVAERPFDREFVRRSAEPFTWDHHARAVAQVYRDALG
jgi:glycosyltransferase involved in cell wall biosynthesis